MTTELVAQDKKVDCDGTALATSYSTTTTPAAVRAHRRTKSVTRAEEITDNAKKQRNSQPDRPCHRPQDSLFSWSSDFHNFTGLVNWGMLLLTMGGFRLLLENFIKYGIRIDPMQWLTVITGKDEGEGLPSVILIAYSLVPVIICLLIEKGLSVAIIVQNAGTFAHIFNIIVLVLIPMVTIHFKGHTFSLIGAMTVCFVYSILFLKLWSYIQVNRWCRAHRAASFSRRRTQSISMAELKKNQKNIEMKTSVDRKEEPLPKQIVVEYPHNLKINDILYFLLAPTLCYELNFPRTSRIRKRFLLKRILEVIIGVNVVMGLFQQWMIPSVKNSLIPFSNMDVAKATERLLKLSIPNHLVWLCFFYLTFHSFLNLIGELLQFADRNFYNDWWNANNIDIFWRTWNMPVHRWCVRHLYVPVVGMGYGKNSAAVTVFFLSALLHEYLVSIPLRTFKIWAFMGMMSQMPLAYFARYMENNFGPRVGNMIVWSSIILGQPLCIMMYYHDYMVNQYSSSYLANVTNHHIHVEL